MAREIIFGKSVILMKKFANRLSLDKIQSTVTKAVNTTIDKATEQIEKLQGVKVVKTMDPRYNEAKINYNHMNVNTSNLIGSIMQMQSQMEQLSHLASKMGDDFSMWFMDSTPETKIKIKTTTNFTKQLDQLTTHFLGTRIDPHVVRLISEFQKEFERITVVKRERKKYRKEYDYARAYVSSKGATERDTNKFRENQQKMQTNKDAYDKLNSDFINSVAVLQSKQYEYLEKPIRNLIALMSQYMLNVFTELQKFRTTYPGETFQVNYNDIPKILAETPNPYADLE